MKTTFNSYNETCSSITEYQAALSRCLFSSRLSPHRVGSRFEATVQSRNVGAISILKAYASSPITVKPVVDCIANEASFMFHIQLKGETSYSYHGGNLICTPGTILLTNSKYFLAGNQLTCADVLVVKLPAFFARENSEFIDRYCWIPKDGSIGSASVLKNFVSTVWSSSSGLSDYDYETLPKIFLNLLDAAYFQESKEKAVRVANPNDDLLKRLEEVIIKKLGKPKLSVDELVNELYVSRSKLYRATAEAGTSVDKIIMNLRLSWAKKMIEENCWSNMSLTDIAHEIGFCDQAHFSRSFKKAFGVAPSDYRKKCLNESVP